MIITKRTPTTIIDLWHPRYNDQCFLPAKYKVDHGSNVIIIEFSKSHSEQGLKYCLFRSEIMTYPIVFNGKIECYEVPKEDWDIVETVESIKQTVKELWP